MAAEHEARGHTQGRALEVLDVSPFDLDALAIASRDLYLDEGATPPSDRRLRIELHHRLRRDARAVIFRASADGDPPAPPLPRDAAEPIAFALWSGRSHVRLEQFRVEPAWRRSGWGSRCVERLLQSRLAGAERVTVHVLADNEVGVAFWRALGFDDGRRHLVIVARDGTPLTGA